jgi:hypothetical protein
MQSPHNHFQRRFAGIFGMFFHPECRGIISHAQPVAFFQRETSIRVMAATASSIALSITSQQDDAARGHRCRQYTCRGGGGRAPAPPAIEDAL